MAVYHVFIDGAVDRTEAGTERLTQAIADHYGLAADSLRARIASGRFRVKGNCDRATAESYVADLTKLGATCTIEEASPQNQSLTPLPFPAPSIQPPSKSSLSMKLPSRTTTQPSVRPSSPPATQYQSGLSAAFAAQSPEAELGALGGEVAFTLAAIDGSDDAPPPPPAAAFAPPDASALSAASSFHPPAPTTAEVDSPSNSNPNSGSQADAGVPLDLFAPPEAAEAALSVDLALDEAERVARKRISAPPATAPSPDPPPSAGRYSPPSLVLAPAPAPVPDRPKNPLANERIRFVLGVVVALLIGFLPAHVIAKKREKSAFAAIDANVVETQRRADSKDSYAALDQFRADQLERKHDDRQGIAMMALFIWGLAGGAVAYVWFRRVPWDQFLES